MKTRRISTIVSVKHWELLRKHAEKFESQRRVLEIALENLESHSKQTSSLSPEELLWMRIGRELKSNVCLLHKDIFEELIESVDFERNKEILNRTKPAKYLIAWYCQKPLKECNLKEIMDGIVFTTKNINCLFDTINYTDNGTHYNLMITHTVSMEFSKLFNLFFEDLFKAYGVRIESEVSENNIFMKIYKNS